MQPLKFLELPDHRLENVKGSRLALPAHHSSCSAAELGNYHREHSDQPLAVDLFCGAGGLSLGLKRAGFNVVLAVDRDSFAVETHASHFGGASVVTDISDETALDELLEPLRGRRIDLLAGGPPCQPFSKPARWIRSAHTEGKGSLGDHRRELWASFLYAAEVLKPRSILMENVTDIATNEDGIILRAIFSKMEQLGYSVDCRSYFARELGVAQHRQRVFVVGFKDGARLLDWPSPLPKNKQPTLRDAISDLPPLIGGWNEIAPPYLGPKTALQKALRDGTPKELLFDHVTRAVREDDMVAFRLMNDKTRYNELPEELRRYGSTSFTDKYNRLPWDEPSRTIAAHIAKDGYWYIHPEQQRTLSIREAARIQAFPDWFRFAGFKTSALKQIGEAVSPFVAQAIGKKILEFLGPAKKGRTSSRLVDKHLKIRSALGNWYKKESKGNSLHPWRREAGLWLNMLGEILFSDKAQAAKAPLFWMNFRNDWPDPRTYLKDKHRVSHLKTLAMERHAPAIDAFARHLVAKKSSTAKELTAIGLNEKAVRRALAFSGYSHERPDDINLIRVANRLFERRNSLQKSRIESQITTAVLVGEDGGALLYAAAIELGKTFCSASAPACMLCPMGKHCSHLHPA